MNPTYDAAYKACWTACAAAAFTQQVFEALNQGGDPPDEKDFDGFYEEAEYIAHEFAKRAAPAAGDSTTEIKCE